MPPPSDAPPTPSPDASEAIAATGASAETGAAQDPPPAKPKRRKRRVWVSLVFLLIITAVTLTARSEWAARKTVQTLSNLLRQQTGLDVQIGGASWSWRRFAIHVEGLELRHPQHGRLAWVAWADIRPTIRTLIKGPIRIASVEIDQAEVRLIFRRGQLINGPILRPGPAPAPGPPVLPFRDIALSGLRVTVDHDTAGQFELRGVDLDVRNDNNRRLLIGLSARGGSVHSSLRSVKTHELCFDGPIQRIEARAELTGYNALRVGAARVEALGATVTVSDARLSLDMRSPIDASVRAQLPLSLVSCPLPRDAPMLRGDVSASVHATINPRTGAAQTEGHLSARGLTVTLFDPNPLGRNGTFGAGQRIEADFHGDENAIVIDRLDAQYAGGRVIAPSPRRPDRPLTLHLRPTVTAEGFFEAQGLHFEQLLRELAVTDFARVLWTIDALGELHLDPARFAVPSDRARPALRIDIAAETQDFAIIKDFHRWGPPHSPILAIPRGRVGLTLEMDSLFVRFRQMHLDLPRSHVEGDEVEIRTIRSPTADDIAIRNIHGRNIDLSDVGAIAGLSLAGHADVTVNGGGHFPDILVQGTTTIRDFRFNDLPVGLVQTAPGHPWQLRGVTLRAPQMLGSQGRSTYVVHNALLDFSRYTLVAGAQVESSDFQLADYFHIFKFEHDPVFEPYTGGTMQDCALASHDSTLPRSECWVSDTRRASSRRGEERPANARPRHGFLRTDVSFVLGRPGDDSEGVLHADVRAWDLAVHSLGETVQHVDVHTTYDWLVRARGFRGARLNVEYARGRVANGVLEAQGAVDLGGRMHFSGAVRDADLGRLAMLSDQNLRGIVTGSGVLEGTTEEQRWSIDLDVHGLTAAQRDLGEAHMSIRARPDPSGRAVQDSVNARLNAQHGTPAPLPAPQRWTVALSAIGHSLRANTSLLVPFVQEPWQDVDGVWQHDFGRSWRNSVVQGSVDLSAPDSNAPLDLLPWLPTRLLARLGDQPMARAAVHMEIDELSLHAPSQALARLAISGLDARALGVRLALAPQETLGLCTDHGRIWINPAAREDRAACARPPAGLFGTRGTPAASVALPVTRLLGPDGTRFALSGGLTTEGALALRLTGDADLAQLARRIDAIEEAHGQARLTLAIDGDTNNPELRGLFELDSGRVRSSFLPQPIDDVDLTVRLDGTSLTLDRARARFATSSIDMTGGTVRFRGRSLERIDIPVIVRNLSLQPSSGVDVSLDADTRLSYTDSDPLPTFSGNVTLGRVRYTRPVDMALIQDSANGGAPSVETPYDPTRDRVQLALTVTAREPIRVRNNLIDAEIALSSRETPFRIVGTDQRPSVLGLVTIPRGRLFFRGNEFEVRRSRIEFDNPERISPNFDVLATTEIRRTSESTNRNQWRIDLHAYGTRDRFALDMSAEPSLSREDIALMLTFRMTRAELDQLGAGDFGQVLAVEALSNLTGLDRLVRRNVPLIDDFSITSGYSPAQGRTVPQVSVRVPIAPGVRAGATVNITEQREARGTVDAEINRNISIQGAIDNFSGQARSGAVNVGADLRWRLELE
ncbi:MAG: translocation/assembly module TamB domain-containing protein [Deltaproteobacteria bacterium]|nr:translocation/assembly module TamB domain-containing protein [Deltaproteobacteria bacterium]